MSEILYWDREVYLDYKEEFLDAHAEVETDDDENSTETAQAHHAHIYTELYQETSVVPSDHRMDHLDGNVNGYIHECSNFKRFFRRENKAAQNEEKCDEAGQHRLNK